ncbi:MAG: DsbA family protein [Acidobacteriia bacterium]|nr:DsbA family protein [Terriglobia bacterium]
MTLFRRSLLALLLICLGCSAQSVTPDISLRIERQVRTTYSIPANVKIVLSPLKPSEFPNYDALTITFESPDKKQNYDFLLAKDHQTLVRLVKLDISKDPYAELMKKIDVSGRPVRGKKDAKVVAVNYDDFECPFCSRLHQTLFPDLLKEYGDRVAFIYKDFPLSEIHPWAKRAAVDANCLASQSNDAYWDFADYMHANQHQTNLEKGRDDQLAAVDRAAVDQAKRHTLDLTKLQACIKAQNDDVIKASLKEGEVVGVTATPTLFINGQELDGAVPIAELRAAFDKALEAAGVPVPAHPSAAAPSPVVSQPPSK